ncbi:DUF2069 domain-containing protein [Aquabacterium sp.]|uniref:DUF2069 domain-containing protein n=1 Tax=Aquabacterium sp. TaxID=1872578 RepID=UPI003D6C9559
MPDHTASLPNLAPGQHPASRLRAIHLVRWIAFSSLVGLIALGLLWELQLAPLKGGTGMLAFKVLPLVFGLTGLVKHRLYTFRWLSLLVWLYFTEGAMRATSDTGLSQVLAGIEVLLSLALFTACAVYVRLRLKAGKAKLPATTT